MLLYFLDLFGTVVFAISGVILAVRLRMDVVGVSVLAAVTAVGGGTIRDAILDVPVFWLHDNNYIWLIVATCLLSIMLMKVYQRIPWWVLPISDAIGLAAFVIIGAEKALKLGLNPIVAVIMGTLTGCGGGVIRDVLARRVPFVFRTEIYASACLAGGAVYAGLHGFIPTNIAIVIGATVVLLIRVPAIIWNLSLPTYSYKER